MMVTVSALYRAGEQWLVKKAVQCAEKDAPIYVKMFFDEGFEKVRVN